MKATSIVLMIITVISKIFGLAREKALAYFFGTSSLADVFLIAFQIPMTFSNVIQGAMVSSFIPIYDEIEHEQGTERANKFTGNLAGAIFLICLILLVLGLIFAGQIIGLMAPGFEGQVFSDAVFLTRAGLLSIIATGIYSIFKSYLQIKGHFIVSVSHAILMNAIIIASMVFAKKFGINSLALGIFVGFSFQYIFFHPYLKKSGYKSLLGFNFKDKKLVQCLKSILPIFLATSVMELNFIISKSLASEMFEGAVSTLNFAYKLQSFVTGIVVTSVITAIYPTMSRASSENDFASLKAKTREGLSLMAVFVVPASIVLFFFAEPLVNLLFKGGKFSLEDARVTGYALSFYALGVIAIGLRETLLRLLYALKDTRTALINSIIVVIVNWIMSIILMKSYGIMGLAVATSSSFWIGALLLILSIKSRLGWILTKNFFINLLKILLASSFMIICANFIAKSIFTNLGQSLSLLLSLALGGIVYLLLVYIFKINEVDELKKLIKKLKD